jgi:hypothetical protein
MPYAVKERLYVDKDGKTYTEDELTERSEVTLLATEGGELSDADAEKYGLTSRSRGRARAVDSDERGDAADEAPETEAKSVAAPPENKARTASEKK